MNSSPLILDASTALTKALIRASERPDADDVANRARVVEILSLPEYVGADDAAVADSMGGHFGYQKGDVRDAPDFSIVFRENPTYPFYSNPIWYLTWMRSSGQFVTARPEEWYVETAQHSRKPVMEVWDRTKVSAVCVTHGVDEPILLADRVVLMTNGPQATISKIANVDLPRPRSRNALLSHPDYYTYREEIIGFLEAYDHGQKKEAA